MATLAGKIIDVTSRPPDSISSITVKAPSARIGSGANVIVSSPAKVTFDKTTGDITISGLTGGLSWLYIEGDGWSDSIALAVADGMVTLVEAVANAAGVPGLADYIRLLAELETRIDGIAQGAVDEAAEEIKFDRGNVPGTYTLDDLTPGAWGVASGTVATNLGIPEVHTGTLVVADGNEDGLKTAIFISSTVTVEYPRVWVTSTNNTGSWGAWVNISAKNNYPSLPESELLSFDHTMTGSGAISPTAWVSFNPAPPGWERYNHIPTGEYIFILSTDSPNSDFTLTFRSGNTSSPVVLERTGNRNSPVTVRVKTPGVGSYSVQHASPGSTLTMRVIGVQDSSTWDRRNVPASYTLDDLTPGAWGVASGTVAANLGIPVVATGTLVIAHTLYGYPRTALFTSSTHTTDYTRVWVNSTNNDGIWGQWKELVTADHLSAYVKDSKVPENIAITGAASLDELADGKYQVRAPSEAEKWGLPARQAGWLEKLSFPGAILFRFTTNHVDDSVWPFQVWHRATNGSNEWIMPWVKTSPPEDRDISAELADRPTFEWVNQQIASVDTQASFGTDPDGVPYVMIGE